MVIQECKPYTHPNLLRDPTLTHCYKILHPVLLGVGDT